jgi:hypothetical protein
VSAGTRERAEDVGSIPMLAGSFGARRVRWASSPSGLANVVGQHLRDAHLREVPAHQQADLNPCGMSRDDIAEESSGRREPPDGPGHGTSSQFIRRVVAEDAIAANVPSYPRNVIPFQSLVERLAQGIPRRSVLVQIVAEKIFARTDDFGIGQFG